MIVYPEKFIQRNWPKNIRKADEAIFQPSKEAISLACCLKILENICANRELLLFRGNFILEDSFAWANRKNHFKPLKERLKFVLKNRLLRRKVVVTEPVIWCLNNYSTGGYYHWLSEVLPRLWIARKYIKDSILPIPDYFLERWPFILETIPAFGSPRIKIIDKDIVLNAKTLILPTQTGGPVNYQPEPIKEVARTLLDFFYDTDFKLNTDRVYISRAKAKHRKILNEDELVEVLEQNGFKVFHFETLDFKTQLNISARAKYLVSVHGAGLTNLMFQPSGAKVLEIRTPEPLSWLNCFYTLANVFEVGYYYFLGIPTKETLPFENRPDDKSLCVDIKALKIELQTFLAKKL